MTMIIPSTAIPLARIEPRPLIENCTRRIAQAGSRLFSSRTGLNLHGCRIRPLTWCMPRNVLSGLGKARSFSLRTLRCQGPLETASPNVRAGVMLRAKLDTEKAKERICFSSSERRLEVFGQLEKTIGKHDDIYLAMKDNYDRYIEAAIPGFLSLEDDPNEKCSDNMEAFFEKGLALCHREGRLLHVTLRSDIRAMRPSDFAIVIGLGIKQRYLEAIEKSGHPEQFKALCRTFAERMCEFEIGALCCDVRPRNATGMLGNRIFRRDEGLEPELYARQILNTIYISHLMEKYSTSYSPLFYHYGSEAKFFDEIDSAYRITDLPENKRALLIGALEEDGKDGGSKKGFTADHIVYASLHKPHTEDFRWVNCYRGEFLLEIVNPQSGILTDGIGSSRALEVGFSMDTRFEIISVCRADFLNLDGSLKYHARLRVR